jgi:hypothetical protein
MRKRTRQPPSPAVAELAHVELQAFERVVSSCCGRVYYVDAGFMGVKRAARAQLVCPYCAALHSPIGGSEIEDLRGRVDALGKLVRVQHGWLLEAHARSAE